MLQLQYRTKCVPDVALCSVMHWISKQKKKKHLLTTKFENAFEMSSRVKDVVLKSGYKL
jgi:hypothetical protein